MPELPEIEALREALAASASGREIASTRVRQFALVKTFDPAVEAMAGRRLGAVGRHGKHLLIDVGGDWTLAIHLGIGGRLVFRSAGQKPGRTASLEIGFVDGGALDVVEQGTKKRSSVHLLRRTEVGAHLASLGVDALSPDLTVERLAELLRADRVQIKGFLTDQRRIAGIGNAYSDEILWEARIAPLRLSTALDEGDVERLHDAIGSVLRRALEAARGGNYLLVARGDKRGAFMVHRREGEPCPHCGDRIASIHFAESSLQYCATCQAEGRRYADRRLSRLLR